MAPLSFQLKCRRANEEICWRIKEAALPVCELGTCAKGEVGGPGYNQRVGQILSNTNANKDTNTNVNTNTNSFSKANELSCQ